MIDEQPPVNLEVASRDLDRMSSAIGSNELSGQTIQSDAGKSALAALLMSAMTGTIDADEARQTIKSALRLG
ncbi:hypothetical protein SSTU70S_05714 [Stutzerimonas stutzeri]